MIELKLWTIPNMLGRKTRDRYRKQLVDILTASLFKALYITAGDIGPDHIPAEQISALAHCIPLSFVVEQVQDLFGNRL